MTEQEVQERIQLFQRKLWQFDEIKGWYGIDLTQPGGFVVRLKIWMTRFNDANFLSDFSNGAMNHHYLELFLQDLGFTSKKGAATALGMKDESFELVLEASVKKGIMAESEAHGLYPEVHVYSSQWVADFHRRFPSLERMTFTSFSSYCRRLHREILEVLEVPVKELTCATSLALSENPPDVGHGIDCITQEPVGLGYQIWLENGKPIQLQPDVCSWITFLRFENLLKPLAYVQRDDQFEAHRDVIRQYISR